MKYFLTLVLYFLLHHTYIYSQNKISIGAQISCGINLPPVNSSYTTNNISYYLKNNPVYFRGVLIQYLIRDLIGVETGYLIGTTTFYKSNTSNSFNKFLSGRSDLRMFITEIPFHLIYKFNHPSNPSIKLNVNTGVALDWLNSHFLTTLAKASFVPNLIAGFRIVDRDRKIGRFEFGIEYRYSFLGRYETELITNNEVKLLESKFSLLSFNLNYFFLNRDLE